MLLESEENDQETTSTVRQLEVERNGSNCGFHLTRSKWDPYPWISAVDAGSAAESAGVRPGDCVLEVNGEDVLGRRVSEIAEAVRARSDQVSLLLWNVGVDPHCKPENLCCGPMPSNMQRLSTCLSTILSAMECPICLDTIPPPTCQCFNGHLICAKCHAKSERCPICRIRLTRGRSLFADQVFTSLIDSFGLSKEINDKVRTAKINQIFSIRKKKNPEIKVTHSYTSKLLERFTEKSSSAENLSNQFLSPRTLLSEFNSSLRAKSLSTSEISSSVPPRSSYRGNSKSNLSSRAPSCRSYESLNGNLSTTQIEDICHCPFNIECTSQTKGDLIIQHFQESHDGPLIQYFKNKITFNLLHSHNDTYYVCYTGKQFFLKIDAINEEKNDRKNDVHSTLIWMWFLGNETIANEYELRIYLYYASCPNQHLLSLNSAVYSLCNWSWNDMKAMQKGVFLSSETIQALSLKSNDILLDIEIKHRNNSSNK